MSELVKLSDIFDIEHGNKFDRNKMQPSAHDAEGAVAFVGRSGERNGVVGFVRRLQNIDPCSSGLMTIALGGSTLSSFVQPKDFYTAQNIDVLSPKQEMSLDMKLYYCLCIESNRFRYSTFGREANRTLKNLMVPSPAVLPHWVEGSTDRAIESLRADLMKLSF